MNNIPYSPEEIMSLYLIHNYEWVREMISPYKEQRKIWLDNQSGVWHTSIEEQYNMIVRSVIIADMTKRLNVTTEQAMMFVQALKVEGL